MLQKLSAKIVCFLLAQNTIQKENEALYLYAFQKIIGTSVSILSALLIGIISGRIFEIAVFILLFIYLRTKTGGFHAGSSLLCQSMTAAITCVVAVAAMYAELFSKPVILLITLVSTIILLFLAPVNHPNFDATPAELSAKRKQLRVILPIISGLHIAATVFLQQNSFLLMPAMSIAFCALLVMAAKILKQEV